MDMNPAHNRDTYLARGHRIKELETEVERLREAGNRLAEFVDTLPLDYTDRSIAVHRLMDWREVTGNFLLDGDSGKPRHQGQREHNQTRSEVERLRAVANALWDGLDSEGIDPDDILAEVDLSWVPSK